MRPMPSGLYPLLLFLLFLAPQHPAVASVGTPAHAAADTARWKLTRLDLDVSIDTAAAALVGEALLRLRLEGADTEAAGLEVGEAARLVSIVAPPGSEAVLDSAGQSATIRFRSPQRVGTEVELRARFVNRGQSYQLVITPKAALASWARGWYPVPVDAEPMAPGMTRLRIPRGWRSVSNGALADTADQGDTRLETWRADAPMARSFIAAAYHVRRSVIGDREVATYLLSANDTTAESYIDAIRRTIAALTPVFGPYPYEGYAVAEVPEGLVAWGGSSEQGFFMSDALGTRVNLPLFAHEVSHGWWGNRVGTREPAALMTSEALAQLGAVLAIEALEGREAVTDFLRFSRDGYSSRQCARGYFTLRRLGYDKPLMQLTGVDEDHNLSDAKGHWVYWMLRERVGDRVFAATLQRLQREFAGARMSLADLRQAFLASAPQRSDLERFFAEWLDRPGAPQLALSWRHGGTETRPTIAVTISQEGDLYRLPVEIAIETTADTLYRTVRVTRARQTFVWPVAARPTAVRLDPRYRLLRWDPDYGPVVSSPTRLKISPNPGSSRNRSNAGSVGTKARSAFQAVVVRSGAGEPSALYTNHSE